MEQFRTLLALVVGLLLSSCASNRTTEYACNEHGKVFSCEKKKDNEVKKVLDDFIEGVNESEARRRRALDGSNLPDRKDDTMSGVANSIFKAIGRLFDNN